MLKEELETILKKVKGLIYKALPSRIKKGKVITVGYNDADIDVNKYDSCSDALQDAISMLKNGGTIQLLCGEYLMHSVPSIQKNILISGIIQEEVHFEPHKRKRLPYIPLSECEEEARVANGQYADPFDE